MHGGFGSLWSLQIWVSHNLLFLTVLCHVRSTAMYEIDMALP